MKRNPGRTLEARIPAVRRPGPEPRFAKSSKHRKARWPLSQKKVEARHLRRIKLLKVRTLVMRRLLVARHGVDGALRIMGRASKKGKMARMAIVFKMAGEE